MDANDMDGIFIVLEAAKNEIKNANGQFLCQSKTDKNSPLVFQLASWVLEYIWLHEYEYGKCTGDGWLASIQQKLREAGIKSPIY